MKKLIKEFHALAWTIAGTGLVLITLSGETRDLAIWISAAALAVHLFGVLISKED
jgi:hypothetical protein